MKYLIIVFMALNALTGLAMADVVIDRQKIIQIESSGNPKAFNKKSKARGLYQITPIVVKEWNNYKKVKYTNQDMFNPEIAFKVYDWYMNKRIPQMLRHYGLKDTVENRLISYNAGIDHAIKGTIPAETKDYIRKYRGVK